MDLLDVQSHVMLEQRILQRRGREIPTGIESLRWYSETQENELFLCRNLYNLDIQRL